MIRLFVGTDPQQETAERALLASVRANTAQPVDITWMRQGEPGWSWGGMEAGWATPFTWFRWFVPKFCGFEGRAIYMDCDMLALGDLAELWEWEIPAGKCCAMTKPADVIVWQCDRVKPRELHQMRNDSERACVSLPGRWNHRDKLRDDTKILHFTSLRKQPWHPYENRIEYKPHPDKEAEALFWEYAKKTRSSSASAAEPD